MRAIILTDLHPDFSSLPGRSASRLFKGKNEAKPRAKAASVRNSASRHTWHGESLLDWRFEVVEFKMDNMIPDGTAIIWGSSSREAWSGAGWKIDGEIIRLEKTCNVPNMTRPNDATAGLRQLHVLS